MENIIGVLILITSLIISGIVSARKQKKENKNTTDTLHNTTDEPTLDQEPAEYIDSLRSQSNWAFSGLEEEDEEEDEKETAFSPHERFEKNTEEEQDVSQPSWDVEKDKPESMGQEIGKPKKIKNHKKTKIQLIKTRFNAREAIIYSEIINRKYF